MIFFKARESPEKICLFFYMFLKWMSPRTVPNCISKSIHNLFAVFNTERLVPKDFQEMHKLSIRNHQRQSQTTARPETHGVD